MSEDNAVRMLARRIGRDAQLTDPLDAPAATRSSARLQPPLVLLAMGGGSFRPISPTFARTLRLRLEADLAQAVGQHPADVIGQLRSFLAMRILGVIPAHRLQAHDLVLVLAKLAESSTGSSDRSKIKQNPRKVS